MNKFDNPADLFKQALTEVTRAMADDAELNINYCSGLVKQLLFRLGFPILE